MHTQSTAPTRTRTRERVRGQQPPKKTTFAPKGFGPLGVDDQLVRILDRQGIKTPRPIQADTVAAAMEGRDVCGRAPTGSGKTLAFTLPLVHLERGRGKPVGLVLAPTRELAIQIAEVAQPLADRKGLRTRVLIGGTKINKDINALKGGVDLVIGCPGRMIDLVNRGVLKLGGVRMAVLDEADRMADMGFMPDVTKLLDATDCIDGQLLLFSATLDDTTDKLERRYQTDPVRVDVGAAEKATGDVSHTWHIVPRTRRRQAAESLLAEHGSAIVFSRTKRGADRLARQLKQAGLTAAAIHGDRTQSQRQRALASFTDGSVGILVATDIAARGIHVDDVDVVMHYDLPGSAEDYTHRSGRTGRAGADGTVLALVCDDAHGDAKTLARDLSMEPAWIGTPSNNPAPAPAKKGNGGNRNRGGGGNRNGGGGGRNGGGGGRNGGGKSGNRNRSNGGRRSGGGSRGGR